MSFTVVAPNARGKEIEQSFYDKAYYKYFNPAVNFYLF